MKSVWIYIENGTFLEAKSFGATGTSVGEIVFNTSLTGYQEIISDPSYTGQFITFTMPEIGNVGCNDKDIEKDMASCSGVIVRNYQDRYSNFRGQTSLDEYLKVQNIIGITNIDTRELTKDIRNTGPKMMIASTEISNKQELKDILESSKRIEEYDYVSEVSTKKTYTHTSGNWNFDIMEYNQDIKEVGKKIVVIDFGIKKSILNELRNLGLEVEVISNKFDASNLVERFNAKEINGIFLSNGPGDPAFLLREVEQIKILLEAKIPMFAICLGHQLLSLANGYPTYKLKFGQHGGNHPVIHKETGVVEITAQNHNYNVPDDIVQIAKITHQNLFDGTIEGLKYNNLPVFSVQHHPEAGPGPNDSKYIFKEFLNIL